MSELSLQGTLVFKGEIETVSASFEKRIFWLKTDEQYPQTIQFELHQGKVEELENFNIGNIIEVSFNLRGREWTNPQGETKCFNTVQAWKIKRIRTEQPQQGSQPAQNAGPQPTQPIQSQGFQPHAGQFNEEEHDDLPF